MMSTHRCEWHGRDARSIRLILMQLESTEVGDGKAPPRPALRRPPGFVYVIWKLGRVGTCRADASEYSECAELKLKAVDGDFVLAPRLQICLSYVGGGVGTSLCSSKNNLAYNWNCGSFILDLHMCTAVHLRQSAWMSKITNDGLTRSGTGCFIAVPKWQKWPSKD